MLSQGTSDRGPNLDAAKECLPVSIAMTIKGVASNVDAIPFTIGCDAFYTIELYQVVELVVQLNVVNQRFPFTSFFCNSKPSVPATQRIMKARQFSTLTNP